MFFFISMFSCSALPFVMVTCRTHSRHFTGFLSLAPICSPAASPSQLLTAPSSRRLRRQARDILVLSQSSPTPASAPVSPSLPHLPCPLAGVIITTAQQISLIRPVPLPLHPDLAPETQAMTFEGESGHGNTPPHQYPPEASQSRGANTGPRGSSRFVSLCPSPCLPFALPLRT